jgi:hypothetical protein
MMDKMAMKMTPAECEAAMKAKKERVAKANAAAKKAKPMPMQPSAVERMRR